ncbi:MAG: hypothetical protein AB7U75_13385 [Hyphomicrobiaceae bacterium]
MKAIRLTLTSIACALRLNAEPSEDQNPENPPPAASAKPSGSARTDLVVCNRAAVQKTHYSPMYRSMLIYPEANQGLAEHWRLAAMTVRRLTLETQAEKTSQIAPPH